MSKIGRTTTFMSAVAYARMFAKEFIDPTQSFPRIEIAEFFARYVHGDERVKIEIRVDSDCVGLLLCGRLLGFMSIEIGADTNVSATVAVGKNGQRVMLLHRVRSFLIYRGGCALMGAAKLDCVTGFTKHFKDESFVVVAPGETASG